MTTPIVVDLGGGTLALELVDGDHGRAVRVTDDATGQHWDVPEERARAAAWAWPAIGAALDALLEGADKPPGEAATAPPVEPTPAAPHEAPLLYGDPEVRAAATRWWPLWYLALPGLVALGALLLSHC